MNEKDKLTIRLVIDIVLVSAALVAAILTTYELHQLRLELEWAQRVNFGVDRILRSHRSDFVLMALGALLMLAGLVALVRVFVQIHRLNRLRGNPLEDAASERAVTAERRGGDKYLTQLDDYLRNGIIDREEYKLLKQRHLRR